MAARQACWRKRGINWLPHGGERLLGEAVFFTSPPLNSYLLHPSIGTLLSSQSTCGHSWLLCCSGAQARSPPSPVPNSARTWICHRSSLILARRWERKRCTMEVRSVPCFINLLPNCKPPSQLTNTDPSLSFTVNLYISKPDCKKPKVGVLYLTDVFGIQHAQNKL